MTLPEAEPSASGALLAAALAVPIAGVLGCVVANGPRGRMVALGTAVLNAVVAIAIAVVVQRGGAPLESAVGGWEAPLGIRLRADGLSTAMVVMAAVVGLATLGFASGDRADRGLRASGVVGARRDASFWGLVLGVLAGLNMAFLCNDLFSLFVAMELLTFAAVPLVCLGGSAGSLAAALRYLLFALIGSLLYLVGVGLLYGTFGTLDIALLSGRSAAVPGAMAALALMTAGLLAKAALFPLHLWLPPAHASALPAASAVLSALVIKGSFFVVLRLWTDVEPALLQGAAAQLVAGLGAAAILFGSVRALQQDRLKPLVAYSTVAQIGYLFLVFGLLAYPLADGAVAVSSMVLTAAVLQASSHALAKAAMFMASGRLASEAGDDRLAALAGVGRAAPWCVLAFGVGGLSLMGAPPSGGFWAKWLLLTASVESGRWWWGLVIVAGGLLSGSYVVRVVAATMAAPDASQPSRRTVAPRRLDAIPVLLAMASLLLGLLALRPAKLVEIGRRPAVPLATEEPQP